ncbi:sentrin-specific protease 5 isoform X1 [Maylandia zebra]|uniref:sentrin-specific protease 5 isoform X1 n=1 Tax=Maylandia zebra TaxID=106582 RepID=UPI00032A0725|nr:sentrin-specific protease 5 isoform X1 [Maylandia zebra]XP_012779909.1 sentrin-specific protease 5 isoform X1 [Maylandia zebra]
MHRAQSQRSKAKYLKRRKGSISLINGVSHMSRRAKRRLYCKLQLWMWRKWREKCHFGIFRAKKRFGSGPGLSLKTQKNKRKAYHALNAAKTSVLVSALGCDTGGSEDPLKRQNQDVNTDAAAGTDGETITGETLVHIGEIREPLRHCHSIQSSLNADSYTCEDVTQSRVPGTTPAQRLEVGSPSAQTAGTPGQDQSTVTDTDETISSKKTVSPHTDVSLNALTKDIHEFLDDFYMKYGSLIPLRKNDVLRHLKGKFYTGLSDRKNTVLSEVTRYRAAILQKPVRSFQVVYKKHTLTLDDLLTLADQNWLNDQVMNMYGELIMDSSHQKVHFLNSFFHRQLMTKGYDGVKRWTKQVDLFSKRLLLVPIHLEVHWCLVTADIVQKKICLYDSQGNGLQKVGRNILKYLMTEAKEKKQTAFESGWTVAFDEKVPQQTNENDCGVFVLEYSRCLALTRPLHFSQKDIPKIRKRIYKELCDCKLHEQD